MGGVGGKLEGGRRGKARVLFPVSLVAFLTVTVSGSLVPAR